MAAGIAKLRDEGFTAAEVQTAIDAVKIELVFTAHPSEAKRRSIRAKLRRMRRALQDLDRTDLLPRERERLEQGIRSELTVLWQTDFLRDAKPTVLDEVARGLSITPRLVEVVPQVYDALRKALKICYPHHTFEIPLFLRFGSWMGGDRDGNPFVTAAVTRQTLLWLRESAIEQHKAMCKKMYDFLSISSHEIPADSVLVTKPNDYAKRFSDCAKALESVSTHEPYRRWVKLIQWRLNVSMPTDAGADVPDGGYRDGEDLLSDLHTLQASLAKHRAEMLVDGEVGRWCDLVRVFGLNLTRLDVRQDARRYREIMTEILSSTGIVEGYGDLPEARRCEVLSQTLPWKNPIVGENFAPLTADTLELFRLLHDAVRSFGPDCLGGHVISLTQCPSDVLNVLWLWRWAQATAEHPISDELRIVPLFEKIEDLKNAAQTLDAMLSHPLYREHVTCLGDRQIIMVGYSDSTKDGGYLAACWGLYEAQSDLQLIAEKHGVSLTFFHGRGGSLGRGGGPACAGSCRCLPRRSTGRCV
ncbi:MAG: phosphoenolpyruvate carboxylase [Pirellulales bacterium]